MRRASCYRGKVKTGKKYSGENSQPNDLSMHKERAEGPPGKTMDLLEEREYKVKEEVGKFGKSDGYESKR